MKRIYLIDCPGIVPPSMTDSAEDILLRGVVRVENVENPAQYIPAVLSKCRAKHLERTYDLKGWSASAIMLGSEGSTGINNMVGAPNQEKAKIEEATRFLDALARKGGRLLKGGEADLDGVAKMVLNDFLRGKIPWFVPPETEGAEGKGVEDGEGRDDALGFTHGKRKMDVREEVGKGDEEVEIEVEAAGEEGGFEGFDEDKDDDEGSEDGIEVDVGESGDESGETDNDDSS